MNAHFPKRLGFLITVSTLLMLCLWFAPMLPARTTGADSAQIRLGRKVFMSRCAVCHKADGTGQSYLGPKANLHRRVVQKKPDAKLAAFIKKGYPPMPAWEGVLTPAQLRAVIRFLRTFKPAGGK